MSSIYISEPATNGKVVLKTTFGDLDVELWPKEAPKAVRNFVQLCMEGYYNNNIFHRIIKNFIAQTGDPSGDGLGGASIYDGEPFLDEFHSRLRFSHRGIVAMATSDPNMNQSQFFITLDKTPDLQGKHTIFGKVTGDTIFNMLRLNDFTVDDNDRPEFPPKITGVEILNNPFPDIVPRKPKTALTNASSESKSKATKNFNLLSFGDTAEEEETEIVQKSSATKMKSSSFFSEDAEAKKSAEEVERRKLSDKEKAKSEGHKRKEIDGADDDEDDKSAANSTREKLAKRKKSNNVPGSSGKPSSRTSETESAEEIQRQIAEEEKQRSNDRMSSIREEQEKLRKEIKAMERKKDTEVQEKKLSVLEEQRLKFLEKKNKGGKRRLDEKDVLEKLSMFTKSLRGGGSSQKELTPEEEIEIKKKKEEEDLKKVDVKTGIKGVDNDNRIDADHLALDDTEINDSNWMSRSLKFEKEVKLKDIHNLKGKKSDRNTTSEDGISVSIFDPLELQSVKPLSQHKRRLLQGNSNLI